MAYMTVRLSAGSYDPVSNSTPVSATVSITWDTAQSYDQDNETGTLTIGSYSTTFSTNYNASRTGSGTEVLGSGSTTIYHNSTGDSVQVVASATSSRYSASDIITLPGGTPSGGSGGDSGGDSGGSSGGSSSTETYQINLIKSSHVNLDIRRTDDNTIVSNGSILPYYTKIRMTFSADEGYELSVNFSDENISDRAIDVSSGSYEFIFTCNTTIVFIATPTSAVEKSVKYTDCTVGSWHQSNPVYGQNMGATTIKGHEWSEDTEEPVTAGTGGYYDELNSAMVSFTTPKVERMTGMIHIEVDTDAGNYSGGTVPIRYALCTSDSTKKLYFGTRAYVFDTEQIGVGMLRIPVKAPARQIVSFDIQTDGLQPDTTYYLYFWSGNGNVNNVTFFGEARLYYDTHFVITVESILGSTVHIDNGTDFIPYEIYIDNGSNWDLYTAYIDNGTEWVKYS